MNNKKLNLICPEERTGYLNYGRGQEVTYLDIPMHINAKSLNEDVENGATQFKELSEFVTKKTSQFVIVDAKNREEGLMAVTYLAGAYNEADKVNYNTFEQGGFAENRYNALSDAGFVLDAAEEESDDSERWIEDPWKIPIINFLDVVSTYINEFQSFNGGGMVYNAANMNMGEEPYWYSIRNEPVCIVLNGIYWMDSNNAIEKLRRFLSNRHVYLLHINNECVDDDELGEAFYDPDEEDGYNEEQRLFTELMLEFTAEIVRVDTTKEEREKYYSLLFENWILQFGKKLEDKFPVDKVASKITKIRNEAKSRTMEKVIKYVLKDESIGEVFKESDFEILDKFKRIGLFKEETKENYTQQLENNIIGLQNVKEDIKSIVTMMKYNRYREKKGLPKSEFHNVHMLLGAPGTAKTTVAKLMGNMMVEEKLLRGNRFTSITGAQLKAPYVGHTAPKVHALFEDSDIIFIDEAYSVAAGNDGRIDSFGQEAIAQLIVELENHANDRLVIFAGYGGNDVEDKDNKMLEFLESNPGIRSRINSTIVFNSYSSNEMVEIFFKQASLKKYKVDKNAKAVLKTYFEERIKMSDFGNGREARSLMENSVRMAAMRVMSISEDKLTKGMLSEIKKSDIQQAILKTKEGIQAQGSTKKTVQSGFVV